MQTALEKVWLRLPDVRGGGCTSLDVGECTPLAVRRRGAGEGVAQPAAVAVGVGVLNWTGHPWCQGRPTDIGGGQDLGKVCPLWVGSWWGAVSADVGLLG